MFLNQKTGFSINEEKLRTNTYTMEDLIADGMLKCSKELDEWWNKQLMTKIKSFVGVNAAVAGGDMAPFTWDGASSTSFIPTGNYDVKIVSSVIRQQLLNNVNSAYFIENGSLFEPWWNAQIQKGNLDGAGDAARIKELKLYFDMWNFNKAGLVESLFMIQKDALAWKTYNRHHDKPRELPAPIGQTRFTFASKNIPGVKYDGYYQMKCVTVGGKDQITHNWRFATYGDVWKSPSPCPITIGGTDYTPTGIYGFKKTA
jgi:hypothetical protein